MYHNKEKILIWWILAGLCLLSLLIKVYSSCMISSVSRDSALYLLMLQVWHETGDFNEVIEFCKDFWIPPLPLYLMYLLMKLSVPALQAGSCVNIVLGSLIPIVGYGIAWEVTRKRNLSIAAALLMAVHPSIIEVAIEAQRDCGYLLFCGAAIWAILAGCRRKVWQAWALAGACLACSLLSRFETGEFILIAVLSLVGLGAMKRLSWKQFLGFLLVFTVVFNLFFWLLVYAMGAETFILNSYTNYYLRKARNVGSVDTSEKVGLTND